MAMSALHLMLSLLLLEGSFSVAQAGYASIYSTEHFFDVVAQPGSTIAARSAILVLYQPYCQPAVNELSEDQHLLYLKHDYSVPQSLIWHHRGDSRDTLSQLYLDDSVDCSTALYFKKGDSILAPTATWQRDMDLLTWVWGFLRTDIYIRNQCPDLIGIKHLPKETGAELNEVEVAAGAEGTVSSYVGHIMVIYSTGANAKTIDAFIVTNQTEVVVIPTQQDQYGKLLDLQSQDRAESSVQAAWVWSHASRHLMNAKQPLVVRNYTAAGYVKLPMPPELFTEMNRFYKENRPVAHEEDINQADGVHCKVGEKQPSMVQLSPELRRRIVDVLRPQMESWSRTKLRESAVYGIREYWRGNVLHNHVDRIDTHVISGIMQIDQDLGGPGGEDWPLEVIDYNGMRHQVKLHPGEMLFYESAKLIHGRPKPFPGVRFANAFIHFAPVHGWDYRLEDSHYYSASMDIAEPFGELRTPLTEMGRIIRTRDEL